MSAENRLELYRKILRSYPDLYKKIEETEKLIERENGGISTSAELYLYTFVPLLTGFVQWVLKQAETKGYKKVYFLARDGWQMYLIAKKLTELQGSDLECRYLNVSRYSMRVPEYHFDLDKAIDKLCVGGIDVTLRKILKRAALTDQETEAVIKDLAFEEKSDTMLNYSQVISLKESLKGSKLLYGYIYEHSKAAYSNAAGYLKQEGLLDSNRQMIVDSGWVGTLQQSIENMLRHENPESEVEGCYFGMYEIPPGSFKEKYNTYYFSSGSGLKRKIHFANSLFEAIISSDEGMTTGYTIDNNRYIPVKDKSRNPNYLQMNENIETLKAFLGLHTEMSYDAARLEDLTEKLLKLFMAEPSETEVGCYGNDLFSDDINDDHLKKVAAELTEKEIKDQRFLNKLFAIKGIKNNEIHESAWIEGSIVRAGGNVKSNLRHARFYKRFVYSRKQLKNR